MTENVPVHPDGLDTIDLGDDSIKSIIDINCHHHLRSCSITGDNDFDCAGGGCEKVGDCCEDSRCQDAEIEMENESKRRQQQKQRFQDDDDLECVSINEIISDGAYVAPDPHYANDDQGPDMGVDLEGQCEFEPLDMNTLTRLVLKFGKTALRYGSGGNHIEDTMKSMILDWLPSAAGYSTTSEDDVYLFVGNKEIFLCINPSAPTAISPNFYHCSSTLSTTGTGDSSHGNSRDRRLHDNYSPNNNSNSSNSGSDRRHYRNHYQLTPITIISGYTEGMNLKKLSLLGEVAKDIKKRKVTLQEAVLDKIPEIENEENPYGPIVEVVLGWMAAGSGLALVLGGCWWDVIVSMVGGAISWAVLALFGNYQPRFVDSWAIGLAAFVPAILITGVKVMKPEINVTVSVLSSVAVPLPGYTISRGLAELASNKVIRGAGHLISGIVCLLWLVVGGYLGARLVASFFTVSSTTPGEPINELWLVFFIPLLGVALNVAFQIGRRDFVPAFFVSMLSYIVTFGASSFANSYVTTFLAATVSTASANAWCAYSDRPQPIGLTPALVFLVSGSIGYRGLSQIFEGDAAEGASQFAQVS